MKQIVKLKVNGVEEEKAVHTHHTLLEVLRAEFKLFGAREGCGIGMCGACTVLLDGRPTSSCLLLAPLAEGRRFSPLRARSEHGNCILSNRHLLTTTPFNAPIAHRASS